MSMSLTPLSSPTAAASASARASAPAARAPLQLPQLPTMSSTRSATDQTVLDGLDEDHYQAHKSSALTMQTVSLSSDTPANNRASALGSGSDVWVHIYHCDPYTGFLNQALLKRAEIGIYHAGVEVYGEEWSFQYFEDTWDDPSISGVVRCKPREMPEYQYQESVNLGPTNLSQTTVDDILRDLYDEWPANSYHLTHNNCLVFAERFVERLRPPQPFPARLKGILEASRNSPSIDAAVDYSWSWIKWWMTRKYQQEALQRAEASAAASGPSLWPNLFHCTCSNSVCMPGIKRDPGETSVIGGGTPCQGAVPRSHRSSILDASSRQGGGGGTPHPRTAAASFGGAEGLED